MKAILELEMPKSCSECELKEWGNPDFGNKCNCLITDKEVQKYMNNQRHPQCPLQPIVPNEEVESKLKQLENYIKDTLMGKIYIDELKQALTTPKISEDDLEFILKWAKIGIWQEREKRFNIMRRIKNSSTLSCYKIIIKELNSNYDRIKTLKSIGGNR